MGPTETKLPLVANNKTSIATIVVPALVAIAGPTFSIVIFIAFHLLTFFILCNSSLYLEITNNEKSVPAPNKRTDIIAAT